MWVKIPPLIILQSESYFNSLSEVKFNSIEENEKYDNSSSSFNSDIGVKTTLKF